MKRNCSSRTLCILVLLIAALVGLPSSYADIVYLKNGGKIEGKVTEDGDQVTIDTKWGPVTVPKGSVVRIIKDGEKIPDGLIFPETGKKGKKKPPKKSKGKKSPKDILKALTRSITAKELSDHVRYLASKKLAGRGTGDEGGKLAAKYLAREFKKYGLKPGGDGGSYLQEFNTRYGSSWNIVGFLSGDDSIAKKQVIVIGAHYDHLGKGKYGSRGGRGARGQIHPGADDNASGTAGVLEIAEAFADKGLPHSRTIVFVCFGAEEIGLVGSRKYVQSPTFPIANTVAMANMDMISRNSPEGVIVYNAGPEWDAVLNEANKHGRFNIKRSQISASDHASFQRAGVPVAFFCTGMTRDLHRPSDTADKCDFKKAERIVETVCLVALGLSSKKGKFGSASKSDMEKQLGGRLGILPGVVDIPEKAREKYDISDERRGILVEKVIEDSPAEKAKIKEGDIIIELNKQTFPNAGVLLQYEKIVGETPGGKAVECIVLRKGIKKKLRVKLPEN